MDWDKLKIFHTVAEASSFTKASTILNLSQSAISRQIQALEGDLKVQLFERHARGLVLTENGEYLYKSAHEIISKLKDVESNLSGHKDKLNGKLTVTTVVTVSLPLSLSLCPLRLDSTSFNFEIISCADL